MDHILYLIFKLILSTSMKDMEHETVADNLPIKINEKNKTKNKNKNNNKKNKKN